MKQWLREQCPGQTWSLDGVERGRLVARCIAAHNALKTFDSCCAECRKGKSVGKVRCRVNRSRVELRLAPCFVPVIPHVAMIELRLAPLFRTRITTCCCSQVRCRVNRGHTTPDWPVQSKIRGPLCAARTLNATG